MASVVASAVAYCSREQHTMGSPLSVNRNPVRDSRLVKSPAQSASDHESKYSLVLRTFRADPWSFWTSNHRLPREVGRKVRMWSCLPRIGPDGAACASAQILDRPGTSPGGRLQCPDPDACVLLGKRAHLLWNGRACSAFQSSQSPSVVVLSDTTGELMVAVTSWTHNAQKKNAH